MKISTGNLLHAYGPRPGDDMHYPYSVRLVVRMADPVDGGCLRRAMEPTARRYPYYCQKLRRQGEEIVLEPNDAPVPVTEGDAPLCLGSPEANGHLFAAAFSGDRLYFDMWHGYADGAGMYNVLRTLLYYYCRERYEPELEPGPIRVLGEEIDPAEAVDPMDALPALLTELETGTVAEVGTETDGDLSLLRLTLRDPEVTPGTGRETVFWFDKAQKTLLRAELRNDGATVVSCVFSSFTMTIPKA